MQANATVNLNKEGDLDIETELKLNNIPFVKLNCKLGYWLINEAFQKSKSKKSSTSNQIKNCSKKNKILKQHA